MGYAKGWLFMVLAAGVAAGVAAVLGGCGAPASSDKSQAAPPVAGAAEKAEPPAGLAELDEADRAAATKQRVCPVTGELLGSMGKPVKIVVQGQTVFLCCAGCEDEIRGNPQKYLAKLQATEGK